MNPSSKELLSLYRTYLRQVRALPHVYIRRFFRIKGADDFRAVLETDSDELRKRKLKRVSKDLRRLQAANTGKSAAFDRVLDIAYGRAGKLRWELMEPLLSDPNTPPPAPIIPAREKSRPPVYSPELTALLTSGISHKTRPLQKHHLAFPTGLPERAKLNSGDAALLGPLSRRREFNIRWRFFKTEQKKVYPPLQVSLQLPAEQTNGDGMTLPSVPRNFGFQDTTILEEVLMLAGSPSAPPGLTRKQRKSGSVGEASGVNPFDGKLPLRWLRRRYQALLGRLPLLIPRQLPQDKIAYEVRMADSAILPSRPHSPRIRNVDAEDIRWISDILPAGRRS